MIGRIYMLGVALAASLCSGHVKAEPVQSVEVEQAARAVKDKVVAWRRDIHEHPELANREFRTSALVAAHLRSLGLEPQTGIAHTGVVAILKGSKPGPRIALRADMDALPLTEQTDVPFASTVKTTFRGESVGVMHACGHDAHTAILMGVAESLVAMRDNLAGEVLFIFQPAEEGDLPDGEQGGAQLMLKEGLFDRFRPDAVFALHIYSTLDLGTITAGIGRTRAASDNFRITVKGKQAHGAAPWLGLDPVVAAAEIIGNAQSIVSRRQNIGRYPMVVTFGKFTAGVKANVIPESAELVGTIRTLDEGMRQKAFADLRNVAESVARAHGATAEVVLPDGQGYAMLVNDPELTNKMWSSLERTVGKGNVKGRRMGLGSEDFSFFAQEVPGMYFDIGARDPARPGGSAHTSTYYMDERALDIGLRAMLQVTLDFLESKEG